MPPIPCAHPAALGRARDGAKVTEVAAMGHAG